MNIKKALERIWHTQRLAFPLHKAGWMLIADAKKSGVGYYNPTIVDQIVMVKCNKYPALKRRARRAR